MILADRRRRSEYDKEPNATVSFQENTAHASLASSPSASPSQSRGTVFLRRFFSSSSSSSHASHKDGEEEERGENNFASTWYSCA